MAMENLRRNGYLYLEDILDNPESHKFLEAKELDIIKHVPKTVTALQRLQKESQRDTITTDSQCLNDILDGGFHCGTMIELCGVPGSGKTQICFQLCIAAQLSKSYGHLNGKVIYIDTRNEFSPLRIRDLIRGYKKRHKNLKLDEKQMLDNIAVLTPSNSDELFDIVVSLRKDLMNHPGVQVVIVDSLSLPIQYSSDSWHRTKCYFYTLKYLRELSLINIAVIVTTEMVNQVDNQGKDFCLSSAGGQITAHRMHKRLMLARINDSKFVARSLKSPLMPQVSIFFQITTNGIRDCT
ncbi:DNA repair protein RAD51 homolog 1-like isoform X2 [Belonocnema kinseyi]|nr:DNA repair protein RAD51 homolog 1-like isoform X2 [Belonocnema kinseyi]